MTDQASSLNLADQSDSFVHVPNAIIVPPLREIRKRETRSGVLDANGHFVAQSISWSSSTRPVNSAPVMPEGEIATRAGRYLFGGILYGHFGHCIVESLARLWAQDAIDGPIDGMIFTPKMAGFPDQSVLKLERLARPLGLRVPMIVANDPLRVDELIVPKQGFGMDDLSRGSDAFRSFMNEHAGRDVTPEGAEKLYISRSKLPPMRGSILGEERLEAHLRDEGYDIFHPQKASPEEQIARYKAARLIIGVDCSPIHLLGYVGSAEQRVAVLSRRSMEIGSYLVTQLRAFKGMDAQLIDTLVNDWLPQPGHRPSRSSFGEVDFQLLHAELLKGEFIKNPTPWQSLSEVERTIELAQIEARHDTTLKPFR